MFCGVCGVCGKVWCDLRQGEQERGSRHTVATFRTDSNNTICSLMDSIKRAISYAMEIAMDYAMG